MSATVTKTFEFSASHAEGDKVVGHNYILKCVYLAADASAEEGLTEKIQRDVIQKLHSRDLGQSVDFLKNVPLNDLAILRTLWRVITEATRPAQLHSLCLIRDRQTEWTLTPTT